jgi:hypothetical protein
MERVRPGRRITIVKIGLFYGWTAFLLPLSTSQTSGAPLGPCLRHKPPPVAYTGSGALAMSDYFLFVVPVLLLTGIIYYLFRRTSAL